MDLHDADTAWRLWTILEAIDWKWPPDVILRQPEALLQDLLEIAMAAGKVRRLREV